MTDLFLGLVDITPFEFHYHQIAEFANKNGVHGLQGMALDWPVFELN